MRDGRQSELRAFNRVSKSSFLRYRNRIGAGLLLGLPVTYVWRTVVDPFLRNGMPTGWDTGAYIAWANSFSLRGFGYVQDPGFIQFSGLNLSPLLLLSGIISLTSSELMGYVAFQVVILASYLVSTFLLSRVLRKGLAYSILVFLFLVSDSAFIRMTRDLYANLLTMAFLQLSLVALARLWASPRRVTALALYLSSLLMLITDIEIGIFGLFVLWGSALMTTLRERSDSFETRSIFTPLCASLITASILWLPYASSYLSISSVTIAGSSTLDWSGLWTQLGGVVILPFWIVGIAYVTYEIREGRSGIRSSILLSWVLAFVSFIVVSLFFRPNLAYRVALLLPIYFLLPEAIMLASNAYRSLGSIKPYARPLMILVLLVVATSISVYSATTFVTQTSSDATSPYVSIGEYRILSNVSNYLKSNNVGSLSTIFLVYPPERTYDPTGVSQWTNLYDNWILATVGPHLTYYGTFENFTKHVPIDLASTNEKATFEFYSARFTSQRSKSDLTLVVVSFLYGGSRLGLIELSQPVTGAYMSKVSFA